VKRAGGGESGSHELTGPVRLARWLLATYPAAFREAHRDEVLEFIDVVLGVLGAVGLTRFLSTFLYGVTATDPQTFIVIAGGLSIVAAVACPQGVRRGWIP